MSGKVSQFIRIITEGATTDGREVTAQMIEDCAETYNPDTYTARINLEHMRSMWPGSDFKMYGEVKALRVGETEIFGVKKKTLEAQLSCDDAMITLSQKDRQKIFFSSEISPNFAKSNKHYLSGLAMTDSPASLGTEILKFASTAKDNPFAARKTAADSMIVEAVEAGKLEFSEEAKQQEQAQNMGEVLLAGLAQLLNFAKKTEPEAKPEPKATTTPESFDPAVFTKQLTEGVSKVVGEQFNKQNEVITKQQESLTALSKQFSDFKTQIEKEPAGTQRARSTGGDNKAAQTDC